MTTTPTTRYTIQQFAELAGVSVRTLHHYDRIGLLKPRARTEAGYRLYGEPDLARLEQIIVLKFLGLSLKNIRELLHHETPGLENVLRVQRRALEEKRRRLEMAIQAIAEAERLSSSGVEPDWEAFKKIIRTIEMQNNNEWLMSHYNDKARGRLEERKSLWSPELQARVEKQWAELIAEVEASLDEDPASPKAQALADRWQKLVEAFTGGDPDITAGLKAVYSDRSNWPAEFQKQIEPFQSQDAHTFIHKAFEARRKG